MKLSPSFVAVKKIYSTLPRSNFSNDELERAAHLILKAEGIVNPLVVARKSLESYEVVDGDFEYYAAARAREIDPRKGEMIGAFILDSDNEEIIKEQVELIRKHTSVTSENEEPSSTNFVGRLNNLELRIESLIKEFKNEQLENRKTLEKQLKEVRSQIPKKSEPLDIFNNSSMADLQFKLKSTGLSEKKSTQIAESVQKERKNKKFESLRDVVMRVKIQRGKKSIKGISSEKMLDIVDSWKQVLFMQE